MNSPYKNRFKVTQEFKGFSHDGLDLVGLDSKEIHSTVNGTVEFAGWENPSDRYQGFGLYVRIRKENSNDRYYFGHLSKLNVMVGQLIKQDSVIGIEGSTGKSTGSHCHYCARTDASKDKILNIPEISGIPNKLGIYQQENITPVPPQKTDVIYQVWDDVKNVWLPNVKNLTDYAGLFGHDVCCIYASLSNGDIFYRVHTKGGKWLPEVKNRTDYAGLYNKPIDAVCFKTNIGKTVKYRVHLHRTNKWLPWVTGYSTNDSENGYAGIIGQEIDAVQIEII